MGEIESSRGIEEEISGITPEKIAQDKEERRETGLRQIPLVEQGVLDKVCVPASLEMALAGHGIEVSKDKLISQYFPEAPQRGVNLEELIERLPGVINEADPNLKVDILDPRLDEVTSKKKGVVYKIKESERAISKKIEAIGENIEKLKIEKLGSGTELVIKGLESQIEYYNSLNKMVESGHINGVFSLNWKEINQLKMKHKDEKIYKETDKFLNWPSIVLGRHGAYGHAKVLDPTRTTEETYFIVDPQEKNHSVTKHTFIDSSHYMDRTTDPIIRISR